MKWTMASGVFRREGRWCDRPAPFGLAMNFFLIIFALFSELRFAIEP